MRLLLLLTAAATGLAQMAGVPRRFEAQTLERRVVFQEGGWEAGAIRVEYIGRNRPAWPAGEIETSSRPNGLPSFQLLDGAQTGFFDGIRYTGLYPGIDLEFRVVSSALKSQFELQPGAGADRISWRYSKGTALRILKDGVLEATTPEGSVRESRLIAWQTVKELRIPVPVAFEIGRDDTVGLLVGPYDKHLPLVIDPVLTFSATTGGSGTDVITGVSRDAAGNIYLAGWTDSTGFSTASPTFPRGGGVDAFVMKLNGSSKNLVYLAYLGGSGDDRALAVAADGDGYVYVCGMTSSNNFPLLSAHQGALNGSTNAFLTKLDPSGRKMLFSTYFGAPGSTIANAIALDRAGNIYVAGQTNSTSLPTVGPFQSGSGGGWDAFVAKFDSSGTVQYASYLGGVGDDIALGVAVDLSGNAYVAGSTSSPNFPVVSPLQNKLKGFEDAFVAKVNAAGSALVYSTFLGGSGGALGEPEQANAITVDNLGNAYVVGSTNSTDFPVVKAYQPAFTGYDTDAFVAKLNPAGSQLVFSTYLGGTNKDVANSVRIDSSFNVYVAGYTASTDFPLVQPLQALQGGLYDAFLTKFAAAGNTVLFSSFLGGAQNDIAYSIAGTNEVIVGGSTASSEKFAGVAGIDALRFGVQINPLAPFGTVDTPQNNAAGLSGAVGITGWALCNDQVPAVSVWREPVAGEPPGSMVFLGNATVVNGARPDIVTGFPNFEFNSRAGWGFAVLTNMLPNPAGASKPIGNGTYRFHAFAANLQNQGVDLGAKTVTVDNAGSSLPFGTIDTPGQGETISGSAYVNFGWVLTPKPATIPTDGSTIVVHIDGATAPGHPVYNNYRADVATLFPGLNNSGGGIAFYVMDTTKLANGIHTISWTVTDNAGHATGVGSRFFLVQN